MDLDTIRRDLERIVQETTAERHHQLDIREQELAAAIELTRDSAVWRQCVAEQRQWFQQLITTQLSYLRPCSSTAMVLRHLLELVGQ